MRPQKRAVLLEAWVTVALLALVPFLIPPLSAQSRGAIVGTVRDPSGALVPGAKIAVTNLAPIPR